MPSVGTGSGPALVEAIAEFFARLTTEQRPVVLFLDDLHWADEGSLSLLHRLTRRAKELPLLIVGTYRDLPPDLQHPLEADAGGAPPGAALGAALAAAPARSGGGGDGDGTAHRTIRA